MLTQKEIDEWNDEPEPDHERIWLSNKKDVNPSEGRLWCEDNVWFNPSENHPPTEYVRADLYEAALAELRRLRGH